METSKKILFDHAMELESKNKLLTSRIEELTKRVQEQDEQLKIFGREYELSLNEILRLADEAVAYQKRVQELESKLESQADTEADGLVFCGKCGKIK